MKKLPTHLKIISVFLLLSINLTSFPVVQATPMHAAQYSPINRIGRGAVVTAKWSPTGDVIAVGTNQGMWLYTHDLAKAVQLQDYIGVVREIAWNPNGSQLVTASQTLSGCMLVVWDSTTLDPVTTFEHERLELYALDWRSNGDALAGGSRDGKVLIWDAETLDLVKTLEGHEGIVIGVAWSPDGTKLASAGLEGTVNIWDGQTYELLATLEDHSENEELPPYPGINAIAWKPDSSAFASAERGGLVHVWDGNTFDCIATMEGHRLDVNAVTWNPDGTQLASGGWDGRIILWNALTFQPSASIPSSDLGQFPPPWDASLSPIRGLEWNPSDNELFSFTEDYILRTWNTETYELTASVYEHMATVTSLDWNPDGSQIASTAVDFDGDLPITRDRTVRVWDASTGRHLTTLQAENPVSIVDWSPDGSKIAAASDFGTEMITLQVWDVTTGENIASIKADMVTAITWSPDSRLLAVVAFPGEDKVHIWDTETSKKVGVIDTGPTSDVVWSSDGSRLATPGIRNSVRVWNANTYELASTFLFPGPDAGARVFTDSLAWSPDSRKMAVRSVTTHEYTISVVDVETNQTVVSFQESTRNFLVQMNPARGEIVWSPDGSKLASVLSSDNMVRIWDATSGELLTTLDVWYYPLAIAWSPTGNRIASGSWEGINIWEMQTQFNEKNTLGAARRPQRSYSGVRFPLPKSSNTSPPRE